MKRVLVIAYYFPPDGSAGVYRPLRFVRELSARGWVPSVVTVDPHAHARYDPRLLEAVPREVDVVRVAHRDVWQAIQARRAGHLARRLEALSPGDVEKLQVAHDRPVRRLLRTAVRTVEASVYYPDLARSWIRPATHVTTTVARQKRPRTLLVSGGPWSSFIVAHRVSQRTGVPFVLDFRDSWTLTCNEDFEVWRPRWAVRQDRRLLDRLFRSAQAVVFRYHGEAESYWRAYPGALDQRRIHIIPNGYEGSIGSFHPSPGRRCQILYTGTVVPYRVDTFLAALSLLKDECPADAERLHVVFLGEGGEQVQHAAAARGLASIVEAMKPVASHDVERLQGNAHALLLLGVKPYQGYELCGSKVFGYLKAARPILGVLPNDETRRVLARVGVTTVADIESPRDIAATIRRLITAWATGALAGMLPDREACHEYSSARQANALVRALDGLPAAEPFVPGTVDIPDSLKGMIGSAGWIA